MGFLSLFSALGFGLMAASALKLPLTRIQRPQLSSYDGDSMNTTLKDRRSYYSLAVQLGTPPQEFELLVDTGSPFTWVSGAQCRNYGRECMGPHYFPNISETATELNETFRFYYGSGLAFGRWWNDSFGLTHEDGPLFDSFAFGVADFMRIPPLTGILGLSGFANSTFPTLIDLLAEKAVFDPPQFTIWLGAPDEQSGSIVFGNGHEDSCGPTLVTVPTLTYDHIHWAFNIDSITANNRTVHRTHGITDTGSTIISMPTKDYKALFGHHRLGLRQPFLCAKPPAQPELSFEIGGQRFDYKTEDLLFRLPDEGLCIWGLDVLPTGELGWVLGDTFIRRFCQIHNYGNRTVGFAHALHHTAGGNV